MRILLYSKSAAAFCLGWVDGGGVTTLDITLMLVRASWPLGLHKSNTRTAPQCSSTSSFVLIFYCTGAVAGSLPVAMLGAVMVSVCL